jgi:UDP-N-acetylglucosamine/UDP-N-acetylgalactosamine diphosphorylase
MNFEEAKEVLGKHAQEQLLRFYGELNVGEQEDLLRQIGELDFSLLDNLSKKDHAQKRGSLEPLAAVEISEIEEKKEEFRAVGLEAIRAGKVGAVLLAGGQGTRLGLDRPKGVLNVGITKELYLFECLVKNLMDVTKEAGVSVPLYVMTSEKNHEDTVGFFKEHQYFGYPEEDVLFFKQQMAPSVDYNGKIYLEEKGRISLSPNGNGGWFTSMERGGILEDVHKRGVEWLNVFAVDNVLQRIADPCFVGATIQSGCASGAKVVSKAEPNERVGVLCLEDKKPSIVEYYEMTEEMIHSRTESGELSYRFGVILNYLFRVDKLEEIMNKYMPVHIVEKKIPYVDGQGNEVKPEEPNGYKFETLVLDMIHELDDCLPYEVVRSREFAPIKNRTGVDSLESARELMKENGIEL